MWNFLPDTRRGLSTYLQSAEHSNPSKLGNAKWKSFFYSELIKNGRAALTMQQFYYIQDIDAKAHRCTTHSRMSSAASRADRRVDTRSKMQMPMAWLVMEGLAIHVADPSAMSLTCTCHAGSSASQRHPSLLRQLIDAVD